MAQNRSQADANGILHESGDRWKLDTLIPASHRLLAPSQIQRTSKPREATKPVLVKGTIQHDRLTDRSIYSRPETAMDTQRRLRKQYSGDEPLPGDILL